jgi:hypothetical protein
MTITGQTTNRWHMNGSEMTGAYRVPVIGTYGRLGVRDLENGTVRIRIEPTNEEAARTLATHFPASNGWRQPGEQLQSRFSKVFRKDDPELSKTIRSAVKALGPITRRRYNWRHLKLAFGSL